MPSVALVVPTTQRCDDDGGDLTAEPPLADRQDSYSNERVVPPVVLHAV